MAASADADLLEDAIDAMDDLFYVFTPEGEYLEWNDQFAAVTGYGHDEIPDLEPTDLIADEDREAVETAIASVIDDHASVTVETTLVTKSGERIPYEFHGAPLEDDDGDIVAIAGVGRDIVQRKQQVEIHESLAQEIQELSVPIVEIWDGIVLSTIIGKLDSAKAEQFTEKLLDVIVESEADVALIDITGVRSVDTQTAQHLIDTIHAVKLLGGQVIITGLNPDISQTLVQLGIGFDVETRSSLQDGLATALELEGVSFD